jgi:hypothetical protein
VIHVAFNKKAGRAPLKELLHNDRVLRGIPEVLTHTIIPYMRENTTKQQAKPIFRPYLNAASDRSD